MESPSIYFLFLFAVPDQFLKWSQLFLRAAPAQSFLASAQLSANTSQYKLSIINYHQIARNINFQSAPFCINHSLSLSTFPQSSHKYLAICLGFQSNHFLYPRAALLYGGCPELLSSEDLDLFFSKLWQRGLGIVLKNKLWIHECCNQKIKTYVRVCVLIWN